MHSEKRFRLGVSLTPILLAWAVLAALIAPADATEPLSRLIDSVTLQRNLGPINDGCMTQVLYNLRHPSVAKDGRCPVEGPCDDPTERDNWLFQPENDTLVVRIFFNIFAEDDGSNPAVSYPNLSIAVDTLKSRYAPYGITFEWGYRFINDSRFRDMDGFDDQYQAKLEYSVDPERQCNIYVGDVHDGDSWYSYGYFPWDPDAITYQGGIMMNTYQMPPYSYTTLAHEMGHNLGLWHTHHGVVEVVACGPCYEFPNTTDHDYTGDLCSDTYPTPVTWSCYPPTVPDSCTGLSWGPGEGDNLMSYAPTECRVEVTAQQGARVRCWTVGELSSWLSPVCIRSDKTEGAAPFEVQFTGATSLTVDNWLWDFGDGEYADVQNPIHTFAAPGLYDVKVTVETADGSDFSLHREMIWAQGDTLSFPQIDAVTGQSTRVDISACNSLPLDQLYISFTWAGDINLQFDSVSTTGLRTDHVASKDLTGLSTDYSLAAFRFRTDGINLIEDGSGPVLSVWFTAPYGATGSNALAVTSYGSNQPRFVTFRGTIYPERADGLLRICLPGDANADGVGPTIEDLVYLVSYMFSSGPPPPIMAAVDVDGSGGDPNIADLVYLVTYMFASGPSPVCGP